MLSDDEVCRTCVDLGADIYKDGSGIDICMCDQCPYNGDSQAEDET